MIAVYFANIHKLAGEQERYLELLLPKRRIKAQRYLFEEDRLRCIAGGLLMQKILGIQKEEELTHNAYGKPILKSGDVQFNISHSGDFVAMAVDALPIGVDIEQVKNADREVAQRCFQKNELAYVFDGGAGSGERFFSVWTCKESLMKATGWGMQLAPESFCVLPFGKVQQDGRTWYIRQYKPDCRHILSVCALNDNFAYDVQEIEFKSNQSITNC